MHSPLLGRVLLAAGGLLVVLGNLWPEVGVAVHNRLHPDAPRPAPDRSHWVVVREDLDMLADPDPDLDAWNYDVYRAEGAGLTYLAVLGVVLAVSAVVARSRRAAVAFYAFHAGAYGGLAYLAFEVWRGAADGTRAGGLGRGVLAAWIVLLGALAGETLLLRRALRGGPPPRLHPVDAVNGLPAAVLLMIGVALFVVLRGHPHWPADGYAVLAVGALLALAGMVARRPARSARTACPRSPAVGGSGRPTGSPLP